ncbi:acetylornithine/succinyldiaminopimelate aminotransferase [Asticcacaulis biprosthecium C19]|uniref:Acetylornithine aminotransferase n=1 Tax=Asticcacaulis biprosthecium C19 TaxID=715226 RepID=F4QGN9_9CAUL|nr:aspartate aminotransferase family protein [Asticcacaulis biprosthecium]EGF92491.1 acetylornithine/succinyldiaminopimelate aminotransferase [Asticcacaulis biprosthecium C19]
MTASNDHLFGVYARAPIEVDRGQGVRLYDRHGRSWLDFVQGIATNGLGHAAPVLVDAVRKQSEKLWHVSNIFTIPEQGELAEKLCAASFADRVFFTNSGTEAVECALKLARKYHASRGNEERIDIIGFEGAFHGRTYAAVTAAGNETYLKGFGPRLPGFVHLSLDDHDAIRAAAEAPTAAAILVEPVQGEGGARALTDAELTLLRELCDANGLLLIFDEIQCGMGRSGKMWAYEYSGVIPDVMCVAKALGGGFPVGACLATEDAASGMTVGAHGSTFGGNPLAMAVGLAAFGEISSPELLDNVRKQAGYLKQQLEGLKQTWPDMIDEIRGRGLLIGIKLKPNNREIMTLARDNGLLIAGGSDNCVRLLPPLNVTEDECREAVGLLEKTFEAARAAAQQKEQA